MICGLTTNRSELNAAGARLAARSKGPLVHGVRDESPEQMPSGTHVFAAECRYTDDCLDIEFGGDVVVETWEEAGLLSRSRMDGMILKLAR